MNNEILIDINKKLGIHITKENIEDYYDILYSFCMSNYGETSSETEKLINNLFK